MGSTDLETEDGGVAIVGNFSRSPPLMLSLKKPSGVSGKAKRKLADISTDVVESDFSSSSSSSASSSTSPDSDSGSGSEAEDSPVPDAEAVTDELGEPVLSHAERRRQKKRKLNSGDAVPADAPESPTKLTPTSSKPQKGKKGKKPGEIPESRDALSKRQNSVWVGNLAYKTTAVMLKAFFEGLEVTRVHMPMKDPPNGAGPKVNSGFAYVDFATPGAKLVAITLSERNLEGRRLLIKDGEDFTGRPAATTSTVTTINEDGTTTTTTEATTSKPGVPKTGLTKLGQKILAAQKQPPGPTLFFGNLGFEATEESIRQLLEAHRKKPAETPVGDEEGESADDDDEDDKGLKAKSKGKEDKWIRKIRMGTFEDSRKCKGWAFVDFTSIEHATASLINPRNHSLDGRKLTVEYASPDAVRRGGGPRGPDKHKGDEGSGPGTRVRKPKSAGYIRKKPKSPGQSIEEDKKPNKQERKAAKKERKLEKSKRRFAVEKGFGRGGPERGERPRPGAALALAQRATAAILPSQGQKITF